MDNLELPRMVEIRYGGHSGWVKKELLAVLPIDITDRYIYRESNSISGTGIARYMREIQKPQTRPFTIDDFKVGMVLRSSSDQFDCMVVEVHRDTGKVGFGAYIEDFATEIVKRFQQLHPDGSLTKLEVEV